MRRERAPSRVRRERRGGACRSPRGPRKTGLARHSPDGVETINDPGNERSSAQGGESPRNLTVWIRRGNEVDDPPRVRDDTGHRANEEIRGFSHTTDFRVRDRGFVAMVARLRLITWSDYRSSPAREARPRSSAPTTSARARSLSSTTRPLATREPWTRAGAILSAVRRASTASGRRCRRRAQARARAR